jgi:hypothetical protein
LKATATVVENGATGKLIAGVRARPREKERRVNPAASRKEANEYTWSRVQLKEMKDLKA